jgi:probable HAF family extracellular repeat protein
MHVRPLTIAFRCTGLLVVIGALVTQAQADPITYNVTSMGNLIATGFDVNGNVVGQYAGNNVYYTFATSGANAGSLQLSSTPPTTSADWSDPINPGNVPGYSWTSQYGGNAAGQATGLAGQTLSNGQQGVYYAWVYSGGQFTVFPQQYPYSPQINAVGQVVFNANDSSGNAHGYLYSNGQVTDIGTLPGGVQTQISAINDHGVVVGSSNLSNPPGIIAPFGGQPTAIVYENGTMYNVNNLIASGNTAPGYLIGAYAINDAGQILVYGAGDDYLLTPSNLPTVPPPPPDAVPEPSVLAFVGLAIGALSLRTVLRKRTASARRADWTAITASS